MDTESCPTWLSSTTVTKVVTKAYRAQLSPESLRAVLRPQVQKAKEVWVTSIAKADEERRYRFSRCPTFDSSEVEEGSRKDVKVVHAIFE
eukprot:Skav212018  [mRNA]  locus=scaffold984:9959:10927:+ [translate_table: standard]